MPRLRYIGQYWDPSRREVRLLGAENVAVSGDGRLDGRAWDLDPLLEGGTLRRRFRASALAVAPWALWTYRALPFPGLELVERIEAGGGTVTAWAEEVSPRLDTLETLELRDLDCEPHPAHRHLVAPIIPRRAQAFGVTYLNSALERETEGRRSDYGYVYRAVKERRERPELFLKASAPEHIVGPRGAMGLRRDLTNSETMDGRRVERVEALAGVEPELAAVVHSSGRIWGYTLANDVSSNRLENETLLYLYQAKHFSGGLVLGPLVLLSNEQGNPRLAISCRIYDQKGAVLFERSTDTGRINAPLGELISWAAGHLRLFPGEVFATGTDIVPDGPVKVLEEGMAVEIASPALGILRHTAKRVPVEGDLNPDYSRLELEGADAGGESRRG